MQDRHLCFPPYFFTWPRSGPLTFFILESQLIIGYTVAAESTRVSESVAAGSTVYFLQTIWYC